MNSGPKIPRQAIEITPYSVSIHPTEDNPFLARNIHIEPEALDDIYHAIYNWGDE